LREIVKKLRSKEEEWKKNTKKHTIHSSK
jgi:hypothetical protein